MEKNQLNFNIPMLSVRKSTSALGSSDGLNKKIVEKSSLIRLQSVPIPKSEWELAEVTKPAAVPFVWEQIPGRPKVEGGGQPQTPQRSSNILRLPPGRVSDVGRRCSGERSMEQNFYKSQVEVYPIHDHASLLESLRESLYTNEESDSESVDDVYSDALDSQSLAEELTLNCSLSGLSGLEVPNMKSSGTCCVDPQTKDFMMSRFLPAAKSVVLEAPQYIPRKQTISAEQPKQPKKIAANERKPVQDHCYNSNLMWSRYQYAEDIKSEGEDEHDGHDNHRKRSGKAWGFFLPRLCVKKSLCLLNPVPAMKTRIQAPKSPATDVRRLARKAYSGPLDKPARESSNKRIFHSGVLSRELHRVESKQSEPNKFSYSRASYKAGGLISPCRPFKSGEISPYWNATPQSPFTRTRFIRISKEVENSRNQKYSSSNKKCSTAIDACSPNIYNKRETVSINDAVEKTLYIDSLHTVKTVRIFASLEAAKPVNSTDNNLEFLAERRSKEEISPANSCINVVRHSDISKGGAKMVPKSSILDDTVLPSSACVSLFGGMADKSEGAKLNQGNRLGARSFAVNNEPENQTDLTTAIVQSPLPPPLPKSPSESWLWRTMPSVHLRNPLSHSHPANQFQPKKLDRKASTGRTKWETIVKTSNLHHGRGYHSEEIIPHIPHKQNKR